MKNARSHDISRAFVRLFSFLIVFQSCLQELDILRNVLVIRIRFIQRATFIIYQHIEGLCIGTEFNALRDNSTCRLLYAMYVPVPFSVNL